MNPSWLRPGAIIPVDLDTTRALLAEVKRLRRQELDPMEVVATLQACQCERPNCGNPHRDWRLTRANVSALAEALAKIQAEQA